VSDRPLVWDAGKRRQQPECLSDLVLDQLILEEGSAEERARALAHLGACPACEGAREALAAERARFLTEANVPALAADALARAGNAPAPGPARSWLRRLLGPLGLVAAAGVAAMLLFPGRPGFTPKGGFSLSAYVRHAEGAAEGTLHTGEALHPGDRLRFQLGGAGEGYVAVVSVDAAAKISVYYPQGAGAAPWKSGSAGEPLPSAVELDRTLGHEVIVAVRCASPFEVSALVASVRRSLNAGAAAADPGKALRPLDLGCAEARYEITKSPQPSPR
jgi:hypothetical protein